MTKENAGAKPAFSLVNAISRAVGAGAAAAR
jgi:hypothetical protein